MKIRQSGAALNKLLIAIAVAGLLSILILLLPKGFKGDLSLIGNGKFSAVLIFDKNLVGTSQMMELLNDVRSDYEDQVQFLAVDVATPTGQNFIRNERVGILDLLIFGQSGTRQEVISGGLNETQLRSLLDRILAR